MNRSVACLLFALAAVSAAKAQVAKWPDKPVRVIVPFPAGGTNDLVARILKLSEVQEHLRASGGEPAPATPDGFAQVIARDIATWSKVIRDGNIKVN